MRAAIARSLNCRRASILSHLGQNGSAVYYNRLARAVSLLHEEKISARNLAGFAHPAHEQSFARVLEHGLPILILHIVPKIRSHNARAYRVDTNRRQLDRQGTRQGFDCSADTSGHCPSLMRAPACDSGCQHDRAALADMWACVLHGSQCSPIAQLKSMPGFCKVRLCK